MKSFTYIHARSLALNIIEFSHTVTAYFRLKCQSLLYTDQAWTARSAGGGVILQQKVLYCHLTLPLLPTDHPGYKASLKGTVE
jgi:hypothetical protein